MCDFDPQIRKAMQLFQDGKRQEALLTLQDVVETDSENGTAWQCLGIVHFATGDFASAVSCLTCASQLDELTPCGKLTLAKAYANQKKLALAREYFLAMASDFEFPANRLPEIASGLGNLGMSYQALEVCRRILESQPNNHHAVFGVAFYMNRCDMDPGESLPWFAKAFRLAPANMRYRILYSRALYRTGNQDSAIQLVQSIRYNQLAQIRCRSCLQDLKQAYELAMDTIRFNICSKRLRECNEEENS